MIAIGKFGYATRLPILDLVGLTDAHIARSKSQGTARPGFSLPGHSRTDADYVMRRRPDYIVMGRSSARVRLPVHHDLRQHPDFERLYEWDEELGVYRRRD